jgi:uncharacterized protein (TIGR02147 family)
MNGKITTHQWLAAELAEKRASNPRYSLRLFAIKLGFSPGRVSEYISGKRPITLKQALKIADRLSYPPDKRRRFFHCIEFENLLPSEEPTDIDSAYRKLSAEAFAVVADWYHFAILSLMDLDNFKASEEWISARLGISKKTAREAIQRLINIGLLEKRRGQLSKLTPSHATTSDVPSTALRISHKQTLQQASEALDNVPIHLRDITSITMAVNPMKLNEAKKLIKKFRHQLSTLMETGKKTEVYNLNIQLVPVTKSERGNS